MPEDRLHREAGVGDALLRPLQQHTRIGDALAQAMCLLYMGDQDLGLEAQGEVHRLLQCFIGTGAAIETHEQAREHGLGEYREAFQIAQAERIYRELLAHAPDNPDLLHLLGNALRFRGELDEAIERLQRAVLFAPSNAVLLWQCGVTALPSVTSGLTGREELRALCSTAAVGITSADWLPGIDAIGQVLALVDIENRVLTHHRDQAR